MFRVALNENRDYITNNDVEWVIENCQYTKRIEEKVFEAPSIGKVNGLAVYGAKYRSCYDYRSIC